jgi:hypothetical protein
LEQQSYRKKAAEGTGKQTKLFSANNLSENTPPPKRTQGSRTHAKTGAQKTVGTDAEVTNQKVCDRNHWVSIPSKRSNVAA